MATKKSAKKTTKKSSKKSANKIVASDAVKKPITPYTHFLSEFMKIKNELDTSAFGACKIISQEITKVLKDSEISSEYKVVFLVQDGSSSISSKNSDDIYEAVVDQSEQDKILLILNSGGGSIEPAYFISKVCREKSKEFHVAVPRRAKSAATLISLGANKIHMGSISELGPIDPQVRRLPSLALGEAVEFLAELSANHPKASNMIAEFLSRELDLQALGFMRRIADSAVDYAVRLLATNKRNLPKKPEEIGKKLVYGYKDHGFVIDKKEAQEILGKEFIQADSKEYQLADHIYRVIEDAKLALWVVTRDHYEIDFSGSVNKVWVSKRRD